jgi:hypothetical protein
MSAEIVNITTPKQTIDDLRASLATAKKEHGELERAHAAAPSEKRWALVHDARERHAALASRLQIEKTDLEKKAGKAAREEREDTVARFAEHAKHIETGHAVELEALCEAFADEIIALEAKLAAGIGAHIKTLEVRAFEAAELARRLTLDDLGLMANGVSSDERLSAAGGHLIDRASSHAPRMAIGCVRRAVGKRLRAIGAREFTLLLERYVGAEP